MYLIFNIELCCPFCYYMNIHDGHKVLRIDDEESLKKENITIENSSQEFGTKIEKLNIVSFKIIFLI